MIDVFLSFRGEDTRNFTRNLCGALRLSNISAYIDDNGIPRGEEISQALLKAIDNSRISIVVLSPGFASSTWCLNELVKIVDCMHRRGQLVHPIFHGIEPSDVNLKDLNDGCYGKELAKYEEKFKSRPVKVNRWKVALFEVASLPGSHFKNSRSEAHFINEIVEEIDQKLNSGSLCRSSNQLEPSRLSNNEPLDDFRMLVGINGFGERDAKRLKAFLGSPPERDPPNFVVPSSCQKESELQQNEGLTKVLPSFAASTSKVTEELQDPNTRIAQFNILSNVQHSEEIGIKGGKHVLNEVEATAQHTQICTKITFARLVESTDNQGSTSNQSEWDLNSTGFKGNYFGAEPETNALSLENESTSTPEEAKSMIQLLQTFYSRRFSELLHPAGSNFNEDTLNSLLNLSKDPQISVEARSAVQQFLNDFSQWSRDYENANNKILSTTAELSKISDIEDEVATVTKESEKVVSSGKELYSQLAWRKEDKTKIEEELMAVNAEITDLSSCQLVAAKRKRSLLDRVTDIQAKLDVSLIQGPRLRAEQEAAILTKANIEAEWSKLKKLFEHFFMLEF